MRVAVVGATGNAGTAVLRELARREEIDSVVGIARRLPDGDAEPFAGCEWRSLDIAGEDAAEGLEEAFRGADAVIHLAWLIQPGSKRELLRQVNVTGTARVLAAAARAGVKHIAVASSVGAYSPVDDDRPRDETWPTRGVPGSHYSEDKAAQERVMDEFEAKHPGVCLARIRPGLVFQGSAGSQIQRYFAGVLAPVQLLKHVRPPVLPLPKGVRAQAVHSDDVARAYVEAIVRGAHGAYNVCADDVLDAAAIARIVGRGRLLPLPARPLVPLIKAANRAHLLPMDEGWLRMALRVPLLDNSKAKRDLGWRPRTTAAQALEELIEGMSTGEGTASVPMRPRRAAVAESALLPAEGHRIPDEIDGVLLRQYIADHLSGATAGLSRISMMASVYVDTPVFAQLSAVAEDIRQEHAFLQELMKRQGFPRPAAAPAFWAGERLARLKPYSRPMKRSPSGLVLNTELMLAAVTAKLHGWLVLREHATELGVPAAAFERLIADAERQLSQLGAVHEHAREMAFRRHRETFRPVSDS